MCRKTFEPRRFHGAGHQLFHPPVGDPLFAAACHKNRSLFGRKPLQAPPLFQVALQCFHTGIVEVDHPLLVSFAKEADLALGKVDVLQIHPHQFGQTHPAV